MKKKTSTANQNPFNFKDHEHLKQQTEKLQYAHIINRMLSTISVDTNIVVATVIVFGLIRP